MAAAGVFCGIARSLVARDSAAFMGVAIFCYGGIIAIPCYAFVGSLMVLTTTTQRGQQVGAVLAAVVGCAAWISFGIAFLGRWPQVCLVYSLAATGIIGWLLRIDCTIAEGPSPEAALSRLLEVKKRCSQSKPQQDQEPQ
jgi:hypothetical protein